ncbi:HTH domain-containing protein [Streptomyces sp. SP17BM10]|uniref:helix-turn-helix transcriptional regulator n=1 Tax=Streptomyces sp. SP17BM10 TaxID=3002530 RepID=UPI002E78CA3F|nr:HTH domain-containing protein [Streptomyces sp. SP17BM10]MEE1782736.1 HTH domain-containing protein [Streptomyces sp. SP17BM10]
MSIRTVYRDIEALSASGVPVYGEGGRDGGYRLLDGYRTRLIGLTPCEAETLFLLALPGPAADLGLTSYAASAQLKIAAALPAALPAAVGDHAARIGARFLIDGESWRPAAPGSGQLPFLAQAVKDEQAVGCGSGTPVPTRTRCSRCPRTGWSWTRAPGTSWRPGHRATSPAYSRWAPGRGPARGLISPAGRP